MKGSVYTQTDVGPIQLATKTCDTCKKQKPDDTVGWFTVERDLLIMGEWDELDFCSKSCLRWYAAVRL